MNDIHGGKVKQFCRCSYRILGLVFFVLVWNKNMQNLLPVAGLLSDLTLGVSHYIIIVNNCSFKTAFWNIKRFNKGSEFSRSEFSRTRNLRSLENWLRFSTQFYINDNYRFLFTNTWTAKLFFYLNSGDTFHFSRGLSQFEFWSFEVWSWVFQTPQPKRNQPWTKPKRKLVIVTHPKCQITQQSSDR